MANSIIIQVEEVMFCSQLDEAAFFEWLQKIRCVQSFEEKEHKLKLSIDRDAVDRLALLDLLAVFFRYNLDLKQLLIFEKPEFSEWLRRKEAYWQQLMFA